MFSDFLDALVFGLSVTLPSMLLLFLGWYVNKSHQVDAKFCDQASKIVFRYSMPALLFFSIYSNHSPFLEQLNLIFSGIVASLILFIGAEFFARRYVANPKDRGVFVQGVFRSNTMIMGLAFVSSAYGAQGVAIGAIFGGAMTLLFNVLAVLTLSRSDGNNQRLSASFVMKQILKNPLILAILAALLCKTIPIPISPLLEETGSYLSRLALPLALICAGATLDVRSMFKMVDIALWASIGRLLFAPLVTVLVAFFFGLEGVSMGVIFLMTATPVAAASYVMAKAMGANDVAAANIIGITTVGAMPVAALGVVALRMMGWM
ncbi:malonate transporter [Pelistega indica]|uniref:Malonate transporter n=1 Tax=Pelistega indica TaxID=1414851 RepID=V8G2U4_9BURK|nr:MULTISPECIES: AEC family transporter [Pelistega]ETD70760.1 malonate transporter [Pelistega indica]